MARRYHMPKRSLSRGIAPELRAKTGTRTQDLRITNALLYQLSYLGVDRENSENPAS